MSNNPTPPYPIDPPLPECIDHEADIARIVCDLETEVCCLQQPSGDPAIDAQNRAHLITVNAQLTILYEIQQMWRLRGEPVV